MITQPTVARLALLCLVLSPPLAAQPTDAAGKLYRCRDAKGVTSYQQQPCSKQQTAAGEVTYSPEAEPVAPPPTTAPPGAPTAPAAPSSPPVDPAAAAPAPEAPPPPAAPSPAPPAPPPERPSDVVECLRPDSSTYVRSGPCDLSEVGGDPFEGYVTDPKTGERTWVQGETPRRQVRDPARPLTRSQACRLAAEQLSRAKAGKDGATSLLRDAESVRDRHCD